MYRLLPLLCCFLFACRLNSQQPANHHGSIRVSSSGHDLQYADGTPFFWLGDTGWELFHRLKLNEIAAYFNNRRSKGFNVIQAALLAEFDGLTRPNRNGDLPLVNQNPSKPTEKYFRFVDSVVKLAAERDLIMGLLPTWGDKVYKLWGTGPQVFDSSNAYTYGKWLGNRYKHFKNIIWILGGDRPGKTDSLDVRPIWRAMAKGIEEATDHQCFITYHPSGGPYSTSQFIHQESWLDMNMFQSGHGSGHDVACWELVYRDRSYLPAKPTLDAEPNYEDHPVNPWPKWDVANGYFRDYDVRKQLYRSVFAGACGVTYGHHAVWQFMSEREETINYPDRGWLNAINRPGAFQAGYLKKLMLSRPLFNRVADTAMIIKGQGVKGEHMEAFHAGDSSYAMVYLPFGKQVTINAGFIKNRQITAWWYNTRNGTAQRIGTLKTSAAMEFTPPSTGLENDWVLVLDDPSFHYNEPGR